MNSKGFTLIELLASMVILAILMALTIPNIMGILSQNKNANYLEDAKKLVSTAKYRYSSSEFTKTRLTNGRCYQMTIKYLNNGEFDEAPNGGTYFNQYSYVLIQKKDAKHTVYYVSLAEKIKGKEQYYYIPLTKYESLTADDGGVVEESNTAPASSNISTLCPSGVEVKNTSSYSGIHGGD